MAWKRYVVIDSNKVFIGEVDKQKFLSEGDFVAPPQGFYSIIETTYKRGDIVKSIEKLQILFDKEYANLPLFKFPFEFMIFHEENGKYRIYEEFNKDNKPFYELISIKHNFLSSTLDVNFTIPVNHYKNEIYIDNLHDIYVNVSDYLIITVDYYVKFDRSITEITKTIKYPVKLFASHIKSKQSISNKIILNLLPEFAKLMKRSWNDYIYNSTITVNEVDTLDDQILLLANYDQLKVPSFSFIYYFDEEKNKYIIYETFHNDNSGYNLIRLEHNFCSSILDVTLDPALPEFTQTIEIDKDVFEDCISGLTYLIIYVYSKNDKATLKQKYIYDISNIRIFGDNINPYGYINVRHIFAKDLAYWPFKLGLFRYFDSIDNNTTQNNIVDTYNHVYTYYSESVVPTRG